MTFAWMGGNAICDLGLGFWDLRFNSEMDANISNLSPIIPLIFNSSLIRPAPFSLLTALYTPLPLKSLSRAERGVPVFFTITSTISLSSLLKSIPQDAGTVLFANRCLWLFIPLPAGHVRPSTSPNGAK